MLNNFNPSRINLVVPYSNQTNGSPNQKIGLGDDHIPLPLSLQEIVKSQKDQCIPPKKALMSKDENIAMRRMLNFVDTHDLASLQAALPIYHTVIKKAQVNGFDFLRYVRLKNRDSLLDIIYKHAELLFSDSRTHCLFPSMIQVLPNIKDQTRVQYYNPLSDIQRLGRVNPKLFYYPFCFNSSSLYGLVNNQTKHTMIHDLDRDQLAYGTLVLLSFALIYILKLFKDVGGTSSFLILDIALSLKSKSLLKLFQKNFFDEEEYYNRLTSCAISGGKKELGFLLLLNPDLEKTTIYGDTLLTLSLQHDKVEIIQLLLTAGANPEVNIVGPGNITPLNLACYNGNQEMVDTLLKAGADTEIENTENATPLLTACFKGAEGCVELLLEYNANIDHTDFENRTPLLTALYNGHFECCKLILIEVSKDSVAPDNWASDGGCLISGKSLFSENEEDKISQPCYFESATTSRVYELSELLGWIKTHQMHRFIQDQFSIQVQVRDVVDPNLYHNLNSLRLV